MITEVTSDTGPCASVSLTVPYCPTIGHTNANLQTITLCNDG